MSIVEKIKENAGDFYTEVQQENHRFLSWEHCYAKFYFARKQDNPDIDTLSLHLAFYLASWGMYRGSSFLLKCDYRVHIPVVEEILKPEYNCLLELKCQDLLENKIVQERLVFLETKLSEHYEKVRQRVVSENIASDISPILITKVLLGTLGCTPAYDRFFILAVRKEEITSGIYMQKSLLKLAQFYEDNKQDFETEREKYKVENLAYPQMKFLDMALWQIGREVGKAKD